MRYAIISDLHSNTEALDAVLADMKKARADRCVCLGDIVGYGAEPLECIRKIRELGCDTVLGNHDSAAVGDTALDFFNPYARDAVVWTAERLGEGEKEYLLGLPVKIDYDEFTIVHSSLENPRAWGYIMDLGAARRCFERMSSRLCFIGHSHTPLFFREKGAIDYSPPGETIMEENARYIVNVGSVGQPRDGDPRASYVVYDSGEEKIEFRRVAYDVKIAQDKILSAGLPAFLALRLGMGR